MKAKVAWATQGWIGPWVSKRSHSAPGRARETFAETIEAVLHELDQAIKVDCLNTRRFFPCPMFGDSCLSKPEDQEQPGPLISLGLSQRPHPTSSLLPQFSLMGKSQSPSA